MRKLALILSTAGLLAACNVSGVPKIDPKLRKPDLPATLPNCNEVNFPPLTTKTETLLRTTAALAQANDVIREGCQGAYGRIVTDYGPKAPVDR